MDSSETARMITEVSGLAGALGVEIVDIAGQVDEVSEAAKRQEAAFIGLQAAADGVTASNDRIGVAAANARRAAERAASGQGGACAARPRRSAAFSMLRGARWRRSTARQDRSAMPPARSVPAAPVSPKC